MPIMYQREIQAPYRYWQYGHYANGTLESPPFKASEGFEWVEGEPEEGIETYHQLTVPEVREQLRAQYLAAPLGLRSKFSNTMAQVFTALEMGDFELAQFQVESADVSEESIPDAHLREQAEDLKTQLLANFEYLMGLAI